MTTVPINSSNTFLQNVKYRQNMTDRLSIRKKANLQTNNSVQSPWQPPYTRIAFTEVAKQTGSHPWRVEGGQSGLANPVTIKSKPTAVYTMCQNDTRAMVLVYYSHPKALDLPQHTNTILFSPIVVLQRDRKRQKLQRRLPRWMALRHTCTCTHASTHTSLSAVI